MTNREKINQMTNFRFAQFLCEFSFDCSMFCVYDNDSCSDSSCHFGIIEWLNSEVEENETSAID